MPSAFESAKRGGLAFPAFPKSYWGRVRTREGGSQAEDRAENDDGKLHVRRVCVCVCLRMLI